MSKGEARIRIIPAQEARAAAADDTTPSHAAVPPVSTLERLYHRCDGEELRGSDCAIVLSQKVYDEIMAHLGSDTAREHGGLLLGHERQVSEKEVEVWITHSLQAAHTTATSARLTFTEETWAEFDRQTEALCGLDLNLRRVGWYHSHPNHGVFLSSYDLNVCAEFNRPTHVALVVDPIRNEGGFFVMGEEGYRPHKPQGFWEVLEGGEHSVINWRNVSPAVPGEPAAPQGAEADAAQAELTDAVNLSPEEPGASPDSEAARPDGQANDATPESRSEVIRIKAAEQAETNGSRLGGLLPGVPRWALLLVAIVAPVLLAAPMVKLGAQAVEWIRRDGRSAKLRPPASPLPSSTQLPETGNLNGTGATGGGTQSQNPSTSTSGSKLTNNSNTAVRRRRDGPRKGGPGRRTKSDTVNRNTVNRNTVNSNAVNRNTVNSNTVNSNADNNNTRTTGTNSRDEDVDDSPEPEAGEDAAGKPAGSSGNRTTNRDRRRRDRPTPTPTPTPAAKPKQAKAHVRVWRWLRGDPDE